MLKGINLVKIETVLGPILSLYHTFLYQPIFNLVILIYNYSPGPNLGWAIVLLSLLVRLVFVPLTIKGYSTDKKLENLTPRLNEIEGDNNLNPKEKRSKITEIMRQNGINPIAEIVSLLGQLLFLLILYQVVQHGIEPPFTDLYGFIHNPQHVNTIFFFGHDVAKAYDTLYCTIAAGLLFVEQVWEFESKKNIPEATLSGRWYPLLLPIFTFILLMVLPATKAVFIATSVLFSLGIRFMYTLGRIGKEG